MIEEFPCSPSLIWENDNWVTKWVTRLAVDLREVVALSVSTDAAGTDWVHLTLRNDHHTIQVQDFDALVKRWKIAKAAR